MGQSTVPRSFISTYKTTGNASLRSTIPSSFISTYKTAGNASYGSTLSTTDDATIAATFFKTN